MKINLWVQFYRSVVYILSTQFTISPQIRQETQKWIFMAQKRKKLYSVMEIKEII